MENQQVAIQKLQFKPLGTIAKPELPKAFAQSPYKTLQQNNEAAKPAPVAEAPKEPTFSQKELLESRQKGYEEGYAKGYAGAKSEEAETAKKIKANLDDITIKLAAISEAVKSRNEVHLQNLAILALKIARKVAGNALKKDPYIEIENIFLNNIQMLFDEPNISISVNPELVESISERITTLAKIEGFKNNIEISGNPGIPSGSCDIKWNGGGIKSNKDEVWAQIEQLCECL